MTLKARALLQIELSIRVPSGDVDDARLGALGPFARRLQEEICRAKAEKIRRNVESRHEIDAPSSEIQCARVSLEDVGDGVSRDSNGDAVGPERADRGRLAISDETARNVLIRLLRRARELHIPPAEREDLVQEVAIWIARHREAGRPITEAWLRSTLGQFARSLHRARRREKPLDDLQADAEPTRAPRRPSATIEELTRDLGEKERRIVELRLEGHSWESALQRMGICHGSGSRWRSRIRRGIARVLGISRKD